MGNHRSEIISLTAQKVLLSIFNLATPFFEADRIYRVSARKFREENQNEIGAINQKIRYLKRHGYIEHFVEGKEKYFELTPKGMEKLERQNIENLQICRPEAWDGLWRIVIFDISEKHKTSRDILRNCIIKLGFEMIQESVYVYPFECTNEITKIASTLSESKNVLITISQVIQGEDMLIEKFLDKNVLVQHDISVKR